MAATELDRLWHEVTEKVKVRLVKPGLWRAMERARPLLIDDDLLVLGFSPQVAHEAGALLESTTQNIIERALEESAGRSLRLKVIHGESVADWREMKQREAEASQLQVAAAERRRREVAAGQSWEAISDQLTRRYAELPLRQLPQVQAAYLEEAVGTLVEAVQRLMAKAELPEAEQRAYARTLDKVAERAQVPVSLVAWMVQQRVKG